MKHILIACLVFALCLAVGLFSLFYVRASGEETVTLLERSIRQAVSYTHLTLPTKRIE